MRILVPVDGSEQQQNERRTDTSPPQGLIPLNRRSRVPPTIENVANEQPSGRRNQP